LLGASRHLPITCSAAPFWVNCWFVPVWQSQICTWVPLAVLEFGMSRQRPDDSLRNRLPVGPGSGPPPWNCEKNLHTSPLVQVVMPLSQAHPSTGPGMWPPSNAAHCTGYPARHPE
jgi:hypothetical protein